MMGNRIAVSEAQFSELDEAYQFIDELLNSMSDHIAVINRNGEIITANKAWQHLVQQYTTDTLIQPGIGSHYLKVFQQANGITETDTQILFAGIKFVLSSVQDYFHFEYSCSSKKRCTIFL